MASASPIPICVDLDGTLLRTDVLVESLLRLVRQNPLYLLRLPLWLVAGRARLKQEVAARVRLDPGALPYDRELLAYLEGQRAQGRPLLLVTASHSGPAEQIAAHLGLFDEVIATDGRVNLKGQHKRAELVRRFGEQGFDYAGNSAADLEVWSVSREAILVNTPTNVARRLGERPRTVLRPRRRPTLSTLLRTIRAQQWVKNLLVFAPILLAHRYLDGPPMARALLAFVCFSLAASAVYVLNDLLDLEADRHHPRKRHRPFAAAELPLAWGFVLVPLLAGASIVGASFLPAEFGLVLPLYFVVTTLYSFLLKQLVLLDVLTLAGLYTMRIMAGSFATGIVVSEWMLAFSVFVFLSLAAVKRYGELLRVDKEAPAGTKVRGRGYVANDRNVLIQMGLSSGYLAVLVLALYITSESVTELYARPDLLWFVCAIVFYWISRVWLLVNRGEIQDDPLTFAVKDPVTWIVLGLGATIVLAATGAA